MSRFSHSYYVVMCDYGKRGLEATVHPEDTYRDIVDGVRNGDHINIVFIHRYEDGSFEDVTDCIMEDAEVLAREDA